MLSLDPGIKEVRETGYPELGWIFLRLTQGIPSLESLKVETSGKVKLDSLGGALVIHRYTGLPRYPDNGDKQ